MVKHRRKPRPGKLVDLGKQLKEQRRKMEMEELRRKAAEQKAKELRERAIVRNFKIRYSPTEYILLVGEGNCSFGRALIRHWRKKIIAIREKHRQIMIKKDFLRERAALLQQFQDAGIEPNMKEINETARIAAETKNRRSTTLQYGVQFDDILDAENPEEKDAIEGLDVHYKRQRLTLRNCGMRLLVTCYDSQEVALRKYDDLPEILDEIHSAGARVVFGVDAMTMHQALTEAGLVPKSKFDRIVFNFPHVGSGSQGEESILENQGLILGFLANALPMLRNPKKHSVPPLPFYDRPGGMLRDYGDYNPADEEELSQFQAARHAVEGKARLKVAAAAAGDVDASEDADAFEDFDNEWNEDEDEDEDDFDAEMEDLSDYETKDDPYFQEEPAPVRTTNEALLKQIKESEKLTTPTPPRKPKFYDRGGEIHITLKLGEPYDSWRIAKVAAQLNDNQRKAQEEREIEAEVEPGAYSSKFPKLDLLRGLPFVASAFDGYSHRRTIGFKHNLSAESNQELKKGARTYVFVRSDTDGRVKTDDDEEGNKTVNRKTLKPKQRKQKSGRASRLQVSKRNRNRKRIY